MNKDFFWGKPVNKKSISLAVMGAIVGCSILLQGCATMETGTIQGALKPKTSEYTPNNLPSKPSREKIAELLNKLNKLYSDVPPEKLSETMAEDWRAFEKEYFDGQFGYIPLFGKAVTFTYTCVRTIEAVSREGKLSVFLPSGEYFEGRFIQETPATIDAMLLGDKGNSIKCKFMLERRYLGIIGGGFGCCNVSDGSPKKLQVP